MAKNKTMDFSSAPDTPVARTTDNKAPAALICTITDSEGRQWGTVALDSKQFSTGSVGFYGNGKILNPANPIARYQIGFTATLVGSKG